MQKSLIPSLFFAFLVFSPSLTIAQTIAGTSKLTSPTDQSLTIKKVLILPAQDNIDGLYANPLRQELGKIIDEDTQVDLIETTGEPNATTPEDLQENPAQALAVIQKEKADGVYALRIERGVKGTSLILGLATKPDGRTLLFEKTGPLPEANLETLKSELKKLYFSLKSKLPFDGLVLSRRSETITMNLGTDHGMKLGQVIDIVQVVDLERHPRFQFLVSSTRTVLGTAEITKVDDNLSFARIVQERNPGVIETGAKVDVRDFVTYEAKSTPNSPILEGRPDQQVAFGENPAEWVPVESPTFGSVLLYLGLGKFSSNIDIESTTDSPTSASAVDGTQSSDSSLAPSIALEAEIWLTPSWSLLAFIDQSTFEASNPYADGRPEDINFTLNQQALLVGYNFLLTENFFGPKLQLLAGIGSSRTQVDTTDPLVFSSATYAGEFFGLEGFRIGVKGDLDIPDLSGLRLGASMVIVPSAGLTTDPNISGSSSSTINQFRVFGTYKLGERFALYSGVDIQSYVTRFKGDNRRRDGNEVNSMRQSQTKLLIGTQYLF